MHPGVLVRRVQEEVAMVNSEMRRVSGCDIKLHHCAENTLASIALSSTSLDFGGLFYDFLECR